MKDVISLLFEIESLNRIVISIDGSQKNPSLFNLVSLDGWKTLSEKLLAERPAKILSPFLPTAPLHYVPKIQFTQATIDCLFNNKTKNVFFSMRQPF